MGDSILSQSHIFCPLYCQNLIVEKFRRNLKDL